MNTKPFLPAVALALLCPIGTAFATEGGGSTYNGGAENYMAGAVPPPGFYAMVYAEDYQADTLRDNSGNALAVPGFKLHATALAPRLVWSLPTQVAGGNLVAHTILPLVNLSVNVPGASQTKSGLGDVTVGLGVAWHHSANLHSVAALDVVAPTGGYTKGDLVNIGRNYWSFQPMYSVTYIDPTGWNADAKFTLNLNTRNSATDYRSGNEFFVDYSIGWGLGNGWVAGVGGHVRQQFSDDSGSGATSGANRASAMSIGPSFKYDNGKGWFITAKYQHDFNVRNTVQGNALWIKSTIPF